MQAVLGFLAIIFMRVFAKLIFKTVFHGWFIVTTKCMEQLFSKTEAGKDQAILWGNILGFFSHPAIWLIVFVVFYGNDP